MAESTDDKRLRELEVQYKELLKRLYNAEMRISALESQVSTVRGGSGIQ